MIKAIIKYFSEKHIFTNFVVLAVFAGAVLFWNSTNKEQMPNIEMDFVRINTRYPGATAEEIEYFITNEIEELLEGIEGIDSIESTSSQGSSSIRISLEPDNPDRDEVVNEIKDIAGRARLPDDIPDDPSVREYKSSRRAIVDIIVRHKSADLMNIDQRHKMQKYINTLEDRLLRLPEVSDVGMNGYREQFIEIQVKPEKLSKYQLSIQAIISAIKKNNIRVPLGALDDDDSTGLRIDGELDTIDKLSEVQLQSSFEGYSLKLSDVADITMKFEKQDDIRKVNGTEAVRLTVTKKTSSGILVAIDSVLHELESFEKTVLSNSDYDIVVLDDESKDVRNRLSLIVMNGLFGFVLIIIILFIFMDAKSGLWVALGIPFSLGFTMIIASIMGHTINNITLAAVIIVMGMVVDDAIVIAENISRLRHDGMPANEAVIKGTSLVLIPIIASITTTCVAFIPLYFFKGHFGLFVRYIPPIIFMMLCASLIEALIILPSHLKYEFPRWVRNVTSLGLYPIIERWYLKNKTPDRAQRQIKTHWFMKVENWYGRRMITVLKFKPVVFVLFTLLLVYAGLFFKYKMSFVMFPREETTRIGLNGTAPVGTLKMETERMVREVEKVFDPYLEHEIIGYQTSIARGRRGAAANENRFSIDIEIVHKDERKKSSNQLIAEWEEQIQQLTGFDELRFSKSRWGQSSGSAVDIMIQEQNDSIKDAIAHDILTYLQRIPSLENAEIQRILKNQQYILTIDNDLADRLSISLDSIGTTLRTVLEGNNIYNINESGEEWEVILSVAGSAKKDIESVLEIPIPNKNGYLVPLRTFITYKKVVSPRSIARLDGKRILHVYADIVEKESSDKNPGKQNGKPTGIKNSKLPEVKQEILPKIEKLDLPDFMTPLEIAEHLEEYLFPDLFAKYPSANLGFDGEIADTRESSNDFKLAIILVLILIYLILALTLNSLFKPFIIMASILFGCVGIIFALQIHGMLIYGFFSAVGALGLAGVVVNDAIVMLTKLEKEYKNDTHGLTPIQKTSAIAKTRLRAVLLTTITTVAGLLPTAYGIFGYDSMLAEMMLTMAWGLIFATFITLILVPSLYCTFKEVEEWFKNLKFRSISS